MTTLPDDKIAALYQQLQEKVDFTLHPGVFTLHARRGIDNFRYVYQQLAIAGYQFSWLSAFIMSLPSLAFLLFSVFSNLIKEKKHSILSSIFIFTACISPLSLHLWGIDAYRWDTLAITTTFLVLYLLVRYKKENTIELSNAIKKEKKEWIFTGFVIIVSFNLYTNFFSMQAIKHSPFRKQAEKVVKEFIAKGQFSAIMVNVSALNDKKQQ